MAIILTDRTFIPLVLYSNVSTSASLRMVLQNSAIVFLTQPPGAPSESQTREGVEVAVQIWAPSGQFIMGKKLLPPSE